MTDFEKNKANLGSEEDENEEEISEAEASEGEEDASEAEASEAEEETSEAEEGEADEPASASEAEEEEEEAEEDASASEAEASEAEDAEEEAEEEAEASVSEGESEGEAEAEGAEGEEGETGKKSKKKESKSRATKKSNIDLKMLKTTKKSKKSAGPLTATFEESDDEDDDDEHYLQKFDSDMRDNYILNYHPEAKTHNYEEVKALARVSRDAQGIIVDPLHKTIPFLTKYEMTRIIGQRAKQLDAGAKTFVKVPLNVMNGYHIAQLELEQNKLPFIIKRPLPNGGIEYWNVSDLEVL